MEFDGLKTQITLEDTVANGIQIIYTVPANKKFFLIEATLITDAGAVPGICTIEYRNGSDVHVRHLCALDIRSAVGVIPADHFEPGWPIEIPEGFDIVVTSDTGSLTADGDIVGFEVDA